MYVQAFCLYRNGLRGHMKSNRLEAVLRTWLSKTKQNYVFQQQQPSEMAQHWSRVVWKLNISYSNQLNPNFGLTKAPSIINTTLEGRICLSEKTWYIDPGPKVCVFVYMVYVCVSGVATHFSRIEKTSLFRVTP